MTGYGPTFILSIAYDTASRPLSSATATIPTNYAMLGDNNKLGIASDLGLENTNG